MRTEHRLPAPADPDPLRVLGKYPSRLGLVLRLEGLHRLRRPAEHAQPGQRPGDHGQQRGHRGAVPLPAHRRLGLRPTRPAHHRPARAGHRRRDEARRSRALGHPARHATTRTRPRSCRGCCHRSRGSTSRQRRLSQLFEGWDFHDDVDSAPAAFFNAFWRNLQEPVFNDELGADSRSTAVAGGGSGRRPLAGPDDPSWDDIATPRGGADATVAAALTVAAPGLTDRFASTRRQVLGQMHTLEVVANPFGASGIGRSSGSSPRTRRLGGGRAS